jgi:hypothetical protein
MKYRGEVETQLYCPFNFGVGWGWVVKAMPLSL